MVNKFGSRSFYEFCSSCDHNVENQDCYDFSPRIIQLGNFNWILENLTNYVL